MQAIPLVASVTIVVIDCRSGRPVAGAPVASLTVDGRKQVGKRGLKTDAEGRLRILLSVNALPNGINVRIAFRDFSIVREASRAERGAPATVVCRTLRSGAREVADPGPTGFHVFWKGPQRAPSWGWRVANVDKIPQSGEAAAEFRTELDLCLPPDPAQTGAWEQPGDGSGHAVSAHCREPSDPAIVLFALQYTPPLWLDLDALPRPARWAISGGYGSDGVVEGLEHEVPRPGMFLVTRPLGSGRCGGRDYGIYIPHPTQQTKTRTIWGPHAHYGIDLAACEGVTPVFAMFGARVDRAYSSEHGMGHSVWLKAPRADHQIRCAHLAAAPTGLGKWVMAGKQIGVAGRSFNVVEGVVTPYDEPTHLHVEAHRLENNVQHHVEPRECIDPASPHAPENLAVLPTNAGRRLFPCDCESGTQQASECARRGGYDTAIASDGWAVRTGLCPYDPMSHVWPLRPSRSPPNAR